MKQVNDWMGDGFLPRPLLPADRFVILTSLIDTVIHLKVHSFLNLLSDNVHSIEYPLSVLLLLHRFAPHRPGYSHTSVKSLPGCLGIASYAAHHLRLKAWLDPCASCSTTSLVPVCLALAFLSSELLPASALLCFLLLCIAPP